MTLKTRNRFAVILSFFFLTLSAFFLMYLLMHIGSFSNWAIIFGGICMLVYIPSASFYLCLHFAKTPATEILYFLLFLVGTTTELFRFFIPVEILPNTFPGVLVFIGRALFWGHLICFASLFTGIITSSPEQRLNTEQNIFIVVVFSMILATLVPVNTTEITSTFYVKTGMSSFSNILFVIAALLTFVTYAIKAWHSENKNYFILGIDILLIESGFLILNSVGILFIAIVGAVMLFFGTFHYLTLLHKQYI